MCRLSGYQSGRRGTPTGSSLRLILVSLIVLMMLLAPERGTLTAGCPASFSIVHRVIFQTLDLLLHAFLTPQALLSLNSNGL